MERQGRALAGQRVAFRNPPYRLLARYYERFIPEAPGMNRRARGRILGRALGRVRTACDLACGTGAGALDLARAGAAVYAVDLSPVFCRIAREKARRARLPVRVLRQDMRALRLPERVDLVTCEFSALNNLDRPGELGRVFRAVARALRPGGLFLFDVNTPLAHREQVAGTYWFEAPGFKLVLRASLGPDGRRARCDLEWFIPEGGLWRHRRETYHNICWSDREIRRTLRATGFERPRFFEGVDVRPRIPGAKRGHDAYYLARRR